MSDISKKIDDAEMSEVVGGISKDKALSIALFHANLPKDKVWVKKNKIDIDDGIKVFEIEFHANNKEYEYDIDASTGEIRSFDIDSIYD